AEHAWAKQVEAGSSVHLALDRLEPVYLSLDGAVAPRQCDRGTDGCHVCVNATSEATKEALPGGLDPRAQCLGIPFAQHAAKLVCEERSEEHTSELQSRENLV